MENWELELNEYIRQGEPGKTEKTNAWKTAIGLQAVDGLKTSEYLLETAKEHIDFPPESVIQSANTPDSKSQNGTLKLSLEELTLLRAIKKRPDITQKQLAEMTGISERTMKRRTVVLQEKGYLTRENGKRNGHWKVMIEIP